MSKNIVDASIDFCNSTGGVLGLIPSRRQIENTGGYVNRWNTNEFCQYVRERTDKILLVRDHSGPNQGNLEDDGYISLSEDCKNFDVIHIDPWKKYPSFSNGIDETIRMIKFCHGINPNIEFEIGTEESIRKFSPDELRSMVLKLKEKLPALVYEKITYIVIQSGTSLVENSQTGEYDKSRLEEMLSVCRDFGLISKEHNGDYISVPVIHDKFKTGLNCINIAPEFGLIETLTYLQEMEKNWDFGSLQNFWRICLESGRWKKWVDGSFDPEERKRDLIKICGHYVFSHPLFLEGIKSKFPHIDNKIKHNISKKIIELHGQ